MSKTNYWACLDIFFDYQYASPQLFSFLSQNWATNAKHYRTSYFLVNPESFIE